MLRVLLVEDEENIRDTVKLNLEMEDYEVVAVDNGREALKAAEGQHFDVMVVDVMLPEIDGFQVVEQIRLTNRETPIIFLTAKDQASDRIQGLKKGADDYLTKPFVFEELLLRLRRLIERTSKNPAVQPDVYTFGDNEVNFATYEAKGNPGVFTLTKKEAMLLKLLIERRGEVVSRNQILQSVWGYDVYPGTRTIDNFILSFRKYFEQEPKNPEHFLSVRGVGYKFVG